MKQLFGKLYCPAAWIALAAFVITLLSPGIFHDGDTYWHIAAGRWMIDNQAVLRIDPFSFTMAGQAWQTHEWLSEVIMALAYVGLGWSGIALLTAAVFALTAGLITRHLSHYVSGLALVAIAVLALSCTMGGLLARPHILALPCLEIWIAGLVRARAENRSPHWSLLPVMVLWANLHDSFLIGIVLSAVFALEAALETGWKQKNVLLWGGFVLAGIFAALITPYGVYAFSFPFDLMGMKELYTIQEWMPLKITPASPFLIAAALSLYLLLSRGARVRPLRLIVLIGLAYLSLAHARHQVITAIIAPFLLAEPLRDALKLSPPQKHTIQLKPLLFFCFWFLLAACARLIWQVQRTDDAVTPQTALAHVPPALLHQPVFNNYGFGGYLIFSGVAPFIDGRAELYGEKFLMQYDRMVNQGGPALAGALSRYHIHWALLDPKTAVAARFRTLPGWHLTYQDKYAALFVNGVSPK